MKIVGTLKSFKNNQRCSSLVIDVVVVAEMSPLESGCGAPFTEISHEATLGLLPIEDVTPDESRMA